MITVVQLVILCGAIWLVSTLIHRHGIRKGFALGCANERNFIRKLKNGSKPHPPQEREVVKPWFGRS